MCRSLMRTTPAGSETWKPATESCPTMNSVEPPPMSITTVGSVEEARSCIAPRNVSCASSSPASTARVERELVAHALGEVGAVGGVADGGGEHGEVGDAVVGVDRRAVLGEGASRRGRSPLSESDPEASTPSPSRVTVERRTSSETAPVGRDVGDEQPRRVGADVDDGDTCHGRGC